MECIIIGERIYRIRHESLEYIETVLRIWNTLTDKAARASGECYVKSYREALGVPLDATIDEEASYIHATYGEKPYKNKEFVDRFLHVPSAYERMKLPDFVAWLKERDIEASVEPNVFMIDEEVNYG